MTRDPETGVPAIPATSRQGLVITRFLIHLNVEAGAAVRPWVLGCMKVTGVHKVPLNLSPSRAANESESSSKTLAPIERMFLIHIK